MGYEVPESLHDWNTGDWEKVLSIHVGTAHICRACQNLVMVTKGGLGVMELICCGRPMEKVSLADVQGDEA